MGDTEPFSQFESRAHTLQRMINFDSATPEITDLQLAEWITLGLPDDLRGDVYRFELLEQDPFQFPRFSKQVRVYYEARPCRATTTRTGRATTVTANDTGPPPEKKEPRMSEELRWKIHSYLDSLGLCHWCKQHCGSVNRTCSNSIDRSHVNFPPSFRAPPKPADYAPPQAWRSPHGPTSKSMPGRATSRPAGVASAAESNDDLYPHLDKTSAAAIDDINGHIHYGAEETMDLINKDVEAAAVTTFQQENPYFDPALESRIAALLGPDPTELAGSDAADIPQEPAAASH
ncbi:hypothetical protein PTTG_09060 [Puccinia triticina 1-1 BBBD Race 1]|uniref:Uncharacterized protein n=1 Tax=Puccinia triticina (isolate 1-1 / race 1 (BBBD)) TaxID=630390 RepID=A0A180G263_PUCT1|nr:hypothetical protein PTTG_09060 [Puccinia triticina 1-1 BBBD Race 1]